MNNLDAIHAAKATVRKAPATAGEITVNKISKCYGSGLFEKSVVQDCSFRRARHLLTVIIGPWVCG